MRIIDRLSRASPLAMISVAVVIALPLSLVAVQQLSALRLARAEPRIIVNTNRPQTAGQALRARLTRDALAEAVSLELVDADRGAPGTATGIVVTGSQAGVVAFAERVEANAPAARLGDWRITADPAGVRLEGTVITPSIATP